METLIAVRYRNNREGQVDDLTLSELILGGRIRSFYRPSEDRWVEIDRDPVRKRDERYGKPGRRATDPKPAGVLNKVLKSRSDTPGERPPETAREWFEAGFTLLFNSDDTQGAIRAFASAIRKDPSFGRAYLNRGMAFQRIGNLQQSLDDFTRAAELMPNEAKIFYIRGMAMRQLGMEDEFISDLKKAAALGNASARNVLRAKNIPW